MRKTLLVFAALCAAVAAEKRPPVMRGAAAETSEAPKEQLWKAEKLQKVLEKEVAAKYKGEVKSEIRPGPMKTLLVRAWFPNAYPGTGVMSTFIDRNAVSYGIHGERDFADFARASGWLRIEPDLEDFMKLADFAQFEAVVMNMEHLEKPAAKITGERLVVRFVRGFMPNGAYPTEIVIEKAGPVRVVQLPERRK